MTWTKTHPHFQHYWPKAHNNGISYKTYYRRVRDLEWDALRAATTPADGPLKPDPASIRSQCKAAGISHRRFLTVREELHDEGLEPSVEDVIAICIARKKPRRFEE